MQNQSYFDQIYIVILAIGQKMDALQIIQKYGQRVLDQNDFVLMIKKYMSSIPQQEIEKFYSNIQAEFKASAITTYVMNELLRKASKLYSYTQQKQELRSAEEILSMIQKIIQRRNQEIERVFRIFDFDKDCMLNESEFKYFIEYFIPTILPEEFKNLRQTYSSKNVTLYELMTWMQEGSSMRNSIKKFDNKKKIDQQQQPKINYNFQPNSPYTKPIQQPKIEIPPTNKPNISKQPNQPIISNNTQLIDQNRKINPILESIMYEDPNQAGILQSDIQFQNYIILDYNLQGVQDFLSYFNDLFKKKQQFTDQQFKPIIQSLGYQLQQYNWNRLSDIWGQNFQIFVKDTTDSRYGLGKWISPKDIQQGELGDCYFLSTLSSMACRWPDIILELFLTQKYNPCAIYAVRLCIDGIWQAIIIDDYIPTKGKQPAFSQSQQKECWVMLLEKAWAKSYQSYSNIIAGQSREVIRSITGGPTWVLTTNQSDFKAQFTGCLSRKCIMTVGSGKQNHQEMGLLPEHAYSILKVRTVKHPFKGDVTLVKLRNPWGKKEWNGEWSDDSQSWTQQLKDQLRIKQKKDDGIFYMSYDDFIKYFDTINVGYFRKEYQYNSLSVVSKSKKSLYFNFEIQNDGEYYITAIQQSYRHFKEKYSNYEYSPIRLTLGLIGKKGYKYEENKQLKDQELYVGGLMEKGRYILQAKISWLFYQEHNFVISTYGEKQLKIKQIQKDQTFIEQIFLDKARQNTNKNQLSKEYPKILECQELDPSQGIGYQYYQNNSTQTLQLECTFLIMTGLKLKKPERGNRYKILLKPNEEKIILFSIKSQGFQIQQQKQYIVK